MCCGCWEEYGSDKIDNPLVRKAVAAIDALYEIHCAGGYMHIVTDDNNIEDEMVAFCRKAIEENDHNYPPEDIALHMAVLEAFEQMTLDERNSAMGLFDGCWESRHV